MNGRLNANDAWHAVTLEERIELISRVQAQAIVSSLMLLLVIGCVAYGFDEIWLLAAGSGCALFSCPIIAAKNWRKEKPALILRYLAARAAARRYAFGLRFKELELQFIFRGVYTDVYDSEEQEILALQSRVVELNVMEPTTGPKPVWICLTHGGLVLMSESIGGARLEFATPISGSFSYREERNEDDRLIGLTLEGRGLVAGRKVIISSSYAGALYVFERKLRQLIHEHQQAEERERQRKEQLTQIAA